MMLGMVVCFWEHLDATSMMKMNNNFDCLWRLDETLLIVMMLLFVAVFWGNYRQRMMMDDGQKQYIFDKQ